MLSKIEFWTHLLDLLDTDNDRELPISKIFEELCGYLDFGCGFAYEITPEGNYIRTHSYAIYEDAIMPELISVQALFSREDIRKLAGRKVISFRADTLIGEVEQKLAGVFDINSMILVPIAEQKNEVTAFVGIADRRGAARVAEEDIRFSQSILSTLASHMKMKLYQIKLEKTQKVLQSIVNNMGVDIYVNDFYTHEVLYANESMASPYGGVDKMIGSTCWQFLYNDKTGPCEYCPQKKLIDEQGNPTKIYTWDYQRPFDGSWFRVISAAFEWVDGRLAHLVSSIDITESKKNEQTINFMASYDSLTGLPNRYKMNRDIEGFIREKEETEKGGYVMFMDLDGFKEINDSLGHSDGDALLVQIGKGLRENTLIGENCYRYGGDEFVIWCSDTPAGKAAELLDFLRTYFTGPFQLGEYEASCNVSIGVSHYPSDAQETEGLLRKADSAMYTSKERGKGQIHFWNGGNICTAEEYFKGS